METASHKIFSSLPGWKAGSVSWECPSNIAIVKYWGKHGRQLPRNPSLSMTLDSAVTKTKLSWQPIETGSEIGNTGPILKDFSFEGKPTPAFAEKCQRFLESVTDIFPYLKNLALTVETSNTFPHSAGIASSASGMGALGLCLCSMGQQITGNDLVDILKAQESTEKGSADKDFFKNASYVARLGSGSAARSVYGGWTVWGTSSDHIGSSDEEAIPVNNVHQNFDNFQDSILIVSDGEKPVSSRAGHALMDGHPQAEMRYRHANQRLKELLEILKSGDLMGFALLSEKEALELHALMMTSEPPYLLMRSGSLAIMEAIKTKREKENWPIGYTLDAGPNVHLLYPEKLKNEVRNFIETDLKKYCNKGTVIYDQVGKGPRKL